MQLNHSTDFNLRIQFKIFKLGIRNFKLKPKLIF